MPRKEVGLGMATETISGTLYAGKYDAAKALHILESIAEGETLTDICASPEMPSRKTIQRWVTIHPEFSRAFMAARELSAMALEEKALGLAKKLWDPNGTYTGVVVRAYEVAMGQLRWSAARRDPKRFGERSNAVMVVPIQINTTLDMGDGGPGNSHTLEYPDIYRIEARVIGEGEGEITLPDPAEAPEEVTYGVGREFQAAGEHAHKGDHAVKKRGRPPKRVLTPPGDNYTPKKGRKAALPPPPIPEGDG